jgi:hypothetical protein
MKPILIVDNTDHRQIPYPQPWYERWMFLLAAAGAALFGAYVAAVLLFSLERL